MDNLWTIDWRAIFVPSGSLLEIVVRGSIMYLLILAAFRMFRRDAGSLAISDVLVVVLIADAAQNGMAGEYKSLTEGVVLVATIFAWNVTLDWLSFKSPLARRILHPPVLALVRDGKIDWPNLRSQMMTRADLMEQLREQGIDDVRKVRKCCLESDGRLSVIRAQGDDDQPQRPRDRTF